MGKKWIVLSVLVVLLSALAVYAMNNALSQKRNITAADIVNYVNSGDKAEYSWNQKVTLTVETAEGSFSGSSVMRITWRKNTHRINDSIWQPYIYGYAPFVDVPGVGKVFSTMIGNDTATANDAFFANILPSLFGQKNKDRLHEIAACGNCQKFITSAPSPLLIKYSSPLDSSTAQIFNSAIKSKIDVSTTLEPLSSISDIDQALPTSIMSHAEMMRRRLGYVNLSENRRFVVYRDVYVKEMQ